MAELQEQILYHAKNKPLIWERFIDIFFIWTHGEEKLHEFIEYIYNYHASIKFTAEYSKEKKI